MIKIFRAIALLEGITTLALFFVAMPLKYVFSNPALVPSIGMIHGAAFVIYLIAMVVCLWGRGLTAWEWARTMPAACIPLRTFLNDGLLKRKQLAVA